MEPNSTVFEIVCECCGAHIHVDGKTRSIFYTEKKDAEKRSFDEAVKDATSSVERAAEKFDKKMAERKGHKDKLEKLFNEAREKAEKDPNKRPPSIFDWD